MKTRTWILIIAALIVICGIITGGVYYYYITQHDVTEATDPTGDLFDKYGNSTIAEAYLDIVGSKVLFDNNTYNVTINVNEALPELADPFIFIEWDIWIDSDLTSITGWNLPLVLNDIGPDYLLCLTLRNSVFEGESFEIATETRGIIEYQINENVVELRFSKEVIGSPTSFNYVIAVRKYVKYGETSALFVVDKAPNQGHYVFPNHRYYVYVEPGLPTASLETEHATIYYNVGNDVRAKEIAEGFELAYTYIAEDFQINLTKGFTVYVYVTQNDLVEGLKVYSNFSSESAEFFRWSGAPRPINYVMHVSPPFQWNSVAHELTHAFIEEYSGNVYQSIKWLDEGIAEYEGYKFAMGTKYNESVEMWKEDRMRVVHKLLDQGRLFALKSISTEQQLYNLIVLKGYGKEIYSQAFAVVEYLSQTYGLDKCLEILKFMQEGKSREQAVQSALGVSIEQIEIDFKNYLLKY